MQRIASLSIVAGAVMALATGASAATVTVLGTSDIYNASGTLDGGPPIQVNVTGLTAITFSVTGSETDNGSNYGDPDGVGSVSGENVSAASGLSGIQTSTAGFLTGAFVGTTLSSTVPASLNFTSGGLGTSFSSLSPLLQQTFFIGDGLTGDGTGATQTFYVPAGATTLYLGIADACGYSGSPSCYDDNAGSFTVVTQGIAASVPEPGELALMSAGLAGLGLVARRRRLR